MFLNNGILVSLNQKYLQKSKYYFQKIAMKMMADETKRQRARSEGIRQIDKSLNLAWSLQKSKGV